MSQTVEVPDDVTAQIEALTDALGSHLGLQGEEHVCKESSAPSLPDVTRIHSLIVEHPYCLPLYILLARKYDDLLYPDLAAGAAYKALLLNDAVQDESDEYHDQAIEALVLVFSRWSPRAFTNDACSSEHGQGEIFNRNKLVTDHYLPLVYQILTNALLQCGCYRTAYNYCSQALNCFPKNAMLERTKDDIEEQVALRSNISSDDLGANDFEWPNSSHVRREVYPWNVFEPDRFTELPKLNTMMSQVAPKLEVQAVDLPDLTGTAEDADISKQLGVFAKEDIMPGEIVLDETSMLTANNKLQDALCDACSADLPDLDSPRSSVSVSCPECEVVFCSQRCYEQAMESYHPALCEMDIDAISKDVPPAKAADSLYSLLLLRCLAMAETQQCHPLDIDEVKYIWGDFNSTKNPHLEEIPKTLPFSFENNIRLPFHMLEKMDIDIFANPQYDVWVFNTLYAKFRGTASARLSGLGGRAIRGPEVSAVHPMWCLANHSCDPNVSWEWGGSIKFWAREERVPWSRQGCESGVRSTAGIKKDEEVLNHYCDVELSVQERREWARGALGGDCRCARCIWEAKEDV